MPKTTASPRLGARRQFLQTGLIGGLVGGLTGGLSAALLPALAAPEASAAEPPSEIRPSELDEATVTDLQAGMVSGKFTARSLAEQYLARIEEIDRRGPALHSLIEVNPDASETAQSLDKERAEKGLRGPLH